MHKLNHISRIIIAIASLTLLMTFYVPVWSIFLFAPQYPEGLTMNIWLDNLTGDIDIINGLNHYIGMKHISIEMFPEFSFLRYMVLFYMMLGLLVALKGDDRWLFWYLVFTAFGGTFAMFDFYRWGYEYGHNLDPNAAIKVPGFSYQPPVLGHKRLLNFDAYSYPAVGGWIVITAAALMIIIWVGSQLKQTRSMFVKSAYPIILLVFFALSSCDTKPEPIVAGKDSCSFCKMGITDLRYGAEVITGKGKVYKFDDIGCLASWLKSDPGHQPSASKILVSRFDQPEAWLDATGAVYIGGDAIHSPMNFNFAALTAEQKPEDIFANQNLSRYSWKDVLAQAKK